MWIGDAFNVQGENNIALLCNVTIWLQLEDYHQRNTNPVLVIVTTWIYLWQYYNDNDIKTKCSNSRIFAQGHLFGLTENIGIGECYTLPASSEPEKTNIEIEWVG